MATTTNGDSGSRHHDGTIIVTGGGGGIGGAFVEQFLSSPHSSALHGIYFTHPSMPGRLHSLLTSAPPSHTHELIPLDLSDLPAIRAAATSLQPRVSSNAIPPIRALVLIAGKLPSMQGIDFVDSASGSSVESAFVVNYLANFLFLLLVLGAVDGKVGVRVLFMGSTTHDPKFISNVATYGPEKLILGQGGLERVACGGDKATDFKAGMRRYGRSKFCLITFMYELQRRLNRDPALSKVAIIVMDPGAVGGTDLFQPMPFWMFFILRYFVVALQRILVHLSPNGRLRTASKVGSDLLFACFDKKVLGEHPKALYLNGTDISDSSAESHDEAKQKMLWQGSLALAGIGEGDTVLKDWR